MSEAMQDTLFGEPDPEPVRMLTVQQPWAWAIIHAGKDVENRSKYLAYRGRLIIHAGQKTDPAGIEFLESLGIEIPPEALEGGHIAGSVELAGCTRGSTSPWAKPGAFHNVLTDPVPATRKVRARGHLSIVSPPEGWEQAFA